MPMAADFTPRQGQFLAFIYYYTKIHRIPPAETDMQRFFRISPPAVHEMVKTLDRQGYISPVSRASPGPSVFSCPETNCRTWNNGRLRCQSPHSLVLHSVLLRIVQGWLDPDERARWSGREFFTGNQRAD